jgi:predicted ArsR family transcriptional regulator
MIETIAKNFSGALFNFADVDQHPSCWLDRTGEDKIGNIIAAAAIARICFRSKRCRILLVSPTGDVQASRCGKFQAFADGQEHEVNGSGQTQTARDTANRELVKHSFDFLLTSIMFDLMKHIGWRARLFKSTRGKILELLRTREWTVNDLAAQLRLTDNAVRAHLASLERDRLVVQSGMKPGLRKPHTTYGLGPEAEHLFPKAYGRLVSLLMSIFSRQVKPRNLRAGMRAAGRAVASEHLNELRGKTRQQRIDAALSVLKELGGTASFKEEDGKHFIYGNGCPIAAATANHPEACLLAESLLTELIGSPVKEHCIRGPTPSCRFEVK